jgi:ubiquinone/menaquinone biosynthesis C-methylase UbiE
MAQPPHLLSTNPFQSFSTAAARRYEDWYHSPAGRVVAKEEQQSLTAMLATLPAARSVLEVGCGTGYFTRWLASRSDVVLGVDPSPGMLAVARDARGASDYVLATAEALPFADGSVDVVAFVTTLEFLPAPVLALTEAARVARVGILLGVLNLASPLGLRRRLGAWFRPSVYRSARFYTVWSLQRLVHRALPGRVQGVLSTTAHWPAGTPRSIRRLPCGAFIAMAARLENLAKEDSHA